jgi:hypothetical protein
VDFSALLSTALSIMAIASLAGLGLTRGRILNLQESLKEARADTEAIRASRADEREERAREKLEEAAARADLEARVVQLAADLDTLGRTVTGEAHLVAILQSQEEHHVNAVAHWQAESDQTKALLEALNANTAAVLAAIRTSREGGA